MAPVYVMETTPALHAVALLAQKIVSITRGYAVARESACATNASVTQVSQEVIVLQF